MYKIFLLSFLYCVSFCQTDEVEQIKGTIFYKEIDGRIQFIKLRLMHALVGKKISLQDVIIENYQYRDTNGDHQTFNFIPSFGKDDLTTIANFSNFILYNSQGLDVSSNAVFLDKDQKLLSVSYLIFREHKVPHRIIILRKDFINIKKIGLYKSPLELALSNSKTTIKEVELLIDKGYNLNAYTSNNNHTMLMVAIYYRLSFEIIELLIANGADINKRQPESSTALMLASYLSNDIRIANILIINGANIKAQAKYGSTALSLAAHYSPVSVEIIKLLVKHGADINVKSRTITPLILAASTGKVDSVDFLLKQGASINEESRYGQIALLGASGSGNTKIVSLLLENGANVNIQNRYGMTALMSACKRNRTPDTISLLLEKGVNISLINQSGKSALDFFNENKNLEKYKNLNYLLRYKKESD